MPITFTEIPDPNTIETKPTSTPAMQEKKPCNCHKGTINHKTIVLSDKFLWTFLLVWLIIFIVKKTA